VQKASDCDQVRPWFVWLQTIEVQHAVRSAGYRLRGSRSADRSQPGGVSPGDERGPDRLGWITETSQVQGEAFGRELPSPAANSGQEPDASHPWGFEVREGQRGRKAPHGEAAADAEALAFARRYGIDVDIG